MTVTERIDSLIQEQGLSRRQVAIAANIPPSTFQSAMERGKNMTLEMLQRIASTLGVSLVDLLPEPTEEEKIVLRGIVKEIGLPRGRSTVAETKKLIHRVEEIYGERSALLLRLTSIMSDAGVDKVIEYTKSIFQEYMDESIPRTGKRPQTTLISSEGKKDTPSTPDAPDPSCGRSEGE